MNTIGNCRNHRILIIDNNWAMHSDFRKLLCRDDEDVVSMGQTQKTGM